MRVLAITKIFPNLAEPLSAPFNRQQFAALARRCELEVAATIPWFPGAGLIARWSSAGKLAKVPFREQIEGIPVSHPRTLFVPRLAHGAWGPLYAASIIPGLRRYRGKVDVVLGSWAYPDGFAAVIAARLLGVPCVVKLHGSDINVMARLPGPRRQIAWALSRAARVVAVSRALADEVAALGVPRERIAVVMNGVDAALFHVRDRAQARRELGVPEGPLALYVGNLKPEKGVLDLAAAWERVARELPDARLVIVGGGPLRTQVEAALPPRATLAGAQPLEAIPTWMAACDVLVLPSHIEGMPNVVLEALACGRRVVATAVGGVPDLITSDTVGALVPAQQPDALAAALTQALRTRYAPEPVAEQGAHGGWDASAAALHAVLVAAVDASVQAPR
ncbi:MAG: glycosyltransferase family 4 protein [Deltaproteobacteria bacterium]|nr:MAG: glycosyltransferase family 4 protein [Deltaproteobacteria bacterium]TMQ07535.1 MAG: glycosyltransferase family 4 protein [Deltaproteobacteria bacterium]